MALPLDIHNHLAGPAAAAYPLGNICVFVPDPCKTRFAPLDSKSLLSRITFIPLKPLRLLSNLFSQGVGKGMAVGAANGLGGAA